jgi:REP element-mobilizing transposase RayT
MRQLSFFKNSNSARVFVQTQGKRKSKRPLSTRRPIHLILKSKKYDLRKNQRAITGIWNRLSKNFGVRSFGLVVNSNHIHAVVKLHSRELYNQFIQGFTGMISKKLMICWLCRPDTRIALWGKDIYRLLKYLKLNELEAKGKIPYQKSRTRGLLDWIFL